MTAATGLPAVEGADVRHRDAALADGTRLHVAEAGDGAPLVLLHGWPQHWWAWRRVLPALAEDRRVLCPDLRGLGWSDAPPGRYAKEDWAADVIALLDALGVERAALAGHDWGGFVALLVALRAPGRVASVAALNMVHLWPEGTPRAARRLAYQLPFAAPVVGERILRHVPAAVRALIRRGGHPGTAWSRADLDVYAQRLREPPRARASSAIYRTFLRDEVRPLVRGVYAGRRLMPPVLMLTGAADPLVRPATLAGLGAHAERARTEVVDGAGHFLPEERPDAVARALRDHLAAG